MPTKEQLIKNAKNRLAKGVGSGADEKLVANPAFDPRVPRAGKRPGETVANTPAVSNAKAPITEIPTSTVGFSAAERQQVDELIAKKRDEASRGQGTVAQRLDPLLGGEFAKEKFLTEEAKRLNLDIGNLPLDEKSAVTDLEKRLEESTRNKEEQIALQRKINSVQGENLLQTSRGARGGLQAQLAQGQGLQSTARAGALKSTSAFIEKQRQTSIDRLEFAERGLRELDRQLEDARKRGATDLITSLAKRRSGVEAAKQEAELNAAKLEQEIATQANKTTQGLLESLGGGDLTQGLTSVANLELPQLQNLISSFGGDPSQAFQILGASQALQAAKTPEEAQGILGAFQQVADIGLGAAGEKSALVATLQEQLKNDEITQGEFDLRLSALRDFRGGVKGDDVGGDESPVGAPQGSSGGVRTDRNLNPIAASLSMKGDEINFEDKFTREWTKALDKAGIKWSVERGRNFGKPNQKRATIQYNSLEDSIKASAILLGQTSAFFHYKNQAGGGLEALQGIETPSQFAALPPEKQLEVIKGIYAFEGGREGTLFEKETPITKETPTTPATGGSASPQAAAQEFNASAKTLLDADKLAIDLTNLGIPASEIEALFKKLDDNDIAEFDFDPETGTVTEQGFIRRKI